MIKEDIPLHAGDVYPCAGSSLCGEWLICGEFDVWFLPAGFLGVRGLGVCGNGRRWAKCGGLVGDEGRVGSVVVRRNAREGHARAGR